LPLAITAPDLRGEQKAKNDTTDARRAGKLLFQNAHASRFKLIFRAIGRAGQAMFQNKKATEKFSVAW
jgi:hypothetical protein